MRVGVGFLIGTLLGLARLGDGTLARFEACCPRSKRWCRFRCCLVAFRAVAGGHRRAAEVHLIAKAALGRWREHAARLPPDAAALREVGQVYGFTRRQVLEIVLPHAVPTIFTECGLASPRPGCRWWWWNWWLRAKAWVT
jgi:sulfonate transport system permease protein